MHIAGHIGFTLGCYTMIKSKQKFSFNQMLLVGSLALMPDLLDRTLNFIIGVYPNHGIFHSIFFYAAVFPIIFIFVRNKLEYLIVMGGHIVLDIVNTDLRAFMYPLFGWSNNLAGSAMESPVSVFLDHWPKTIGYKLPTQHYLVFEAMGTVLVCLVVWKLIRQRQNEWIRIENSKVELRTKVNNEG